MKTSSILRRSEAEFVAEVFWLAENWECYEPLRQLAQEKLETNISIGGRGIESAIRLMGALSESKVLSKLGIVASGETKEEKK